MPKMVAQFMQEYPQWGCKMQMGMLKSFSSSDSLYLNNGTRQMSSFYVNRKLCALYRIVTMPITLSDP